MDKHEPKHDDSVYDKVFDIIDHPENYTPGQLAEILADPEEREIYNMLCLTASATDCRRPDDTDAAWSDFFRRHLSTHRRFFGLKSRRAASVAVIVGSSVIAVAAGIAVTLAISKHRAEPAPAVAAVTEANAPAAAEETPDADSVQLTATVAKAQELSPKVFEDEPFETIMRQIAAAYNVNVKFNNKETASLHLYYKFDPALSLDEIVSQLNTFEQITIQLKDNTLIIY